MRLRLVETDYDPLDLLEVLPAPEEAIERLRLAEAGQWEAPLRWLREWGYRTEGEPAPGATIRLTHRSRPVVVVTFGPDVGGWEPSEVAIEEGLVWNEAKHPRWPQGTPGGLGGQFMEIGQFFTWKGKTWEIAHIVGGRVYAYEAKNPKTVETAVLPVKTDATGTPTVAGIKKAAPFKVTGGKYDQSNVTAIDPYVHPETHDPSLKIPEGSKIKPEEWKRFGKLDQELYIEQMKRFGKWEAGKAQTLHDQVYAKYNATLREMVKKAFNSQYGSSSGFSISITKAMQSMMSGDPAKLKKVFEDREKARALQAELKAVIQWDLYNRTQSPDITLIHKDHDHEKSWWQNKIIDGDLPVMSGLSQTYHYSTGGFGNRFLITPMAIRNVLLASISAIPSSSGHTYKSEKEISVAEQWQADSRSAIFYDKDLTTTQQQWLNGKTKKPVGGYIAQMFIEAMQGGKMLPTVPAPADIQMVGSGGKQWVDPPNAAAQVFKDKTAPVLGSNDLNPADLKQFTLPWKNTGPDGAPMTTAAGESGLVPGMYFMGLKGAVYYVIADPGDPGGYGLRYVQFNPKTGEWSGDSYNFSGTFPKKQIYILDAYTSPPPQKEKTGESFDDYAWAQTAEEKFVGELKPGDKFKEDGHPYEIMEKQSPAKMKIKSLETGLTGTINTDYKTAWLVPKKGYKPGAVPEPAEEKEGLSADEFVEGGLKKVSDMEVGDYFLGKNGVPYQLKSKTAPSGAVAINQQTGKPYPAIAYTKEFVALTPKIDTEIPYEELQNGDDVQLGKLKKGDQFTDPMAGTLYRVLEEPPDAETNATVAPVGEGGVLGAATSMGAFPGLMVKYYGPAEGEPKVGEKAKLATLAPGSQFSLSYLGGEDEEVTWEVVSQLLLPGKPPSTAVKLKKAPPGFPGKKTAEIANSQNQDVDVLKLGPYNPEDMLAAPLLPYKSATSGKAGVGKGLVDNPKLNTVAPGTVVRDKSGKLWKVLDSGPQTTLTDGKNFYWASGNARVQVAEHADLPTPFKAEPAPPIASMPESEAGLAVTGLGAGDFFAYDEGPMQGVWKIDKVAPPEGESNLASVYHAHHTTTGEKVTVANEVKPDRHFFAEGPPEEVEPSEPDLPTTPLGGADPGAGATTAGEVGVGQQFVLYDKLWTVQEVGKKLVHATDADGYPQMFGKKAPVWNPQTAAKNLKVGQRFWTWEGEEYEVTSQGSEYTYAEAVGIGAGEAETPFGKDYDAWLAKPPPDVDGAQAAAAEPASDEPTVKASTLWNGDLFRDYKEDLYRVTAKDPGTGYLLAKNLMTGEENQTFTPDKNVWPVTADDWKQPDPTKLTYKSMSEVKPGDIIYKSAVVPSQEEPWIVTGPPDENGAIPVHSLPKNYGSAWGSAVGVYVLQAEGEGDGFKPGQKVSVTGHIPPDDPHAGMTGEVEGHNKGGDVLVKFPDGHNAAFQPEELGPHLAAVAPPPSDWSINDDGLMMDALNLQVGDWLVAKNAYGEPKQWVVTEKGPTGWMLATGDGTGETTVVGSTFIPSSYWAYHDDADPLGLGKTKFSPLVVGDMVQVDGSGPPGVIEDRSTDANGDTVYKVTFADGETHSYSAAELQPYVAGSDQDPEKVHSVGDTVYVDQGPHGMLNALQVEITGATPIAGEGPMYTVRFPDGSEGEVPDYELKPLGQKMQVGHIPVGNSFWDNGLEWEITSLKGGSVYYKPVADDTGVVSGNMPASKLVDPFPRPVGEPDSGPEPVYGEVLAALEVGDQFEYQGETWRVTQVGTTLTWAKKVGAPSVVPPMSFKPTMQVMVVEDPEPDDVFKVEDLPGGVGDYVTVDVNPTDAAWGALAGRVAEIIDAEEGDPDSMTSVEYKLKFKDGYEEWFPDYALKPWKGKVPENPKYPVGTKVVITDDGAGHAGEVGEVVEIPAVTGQPQYGVLLPGNTKPMFHTEDQITDVVEPQWQAGDKVVLPSGQVAEVVQWKPDTDHLQVKLPGQTIGQATWMSAGEVERVSGYGDIAPAETEFSPGAKVKVLPNVVKPFEGEVVEVDWAKGKVLVQGKLSSGKTSGKSWWPLEKVVGVAPEIDTMDPQGAFKAVTEDDEPYTYDGIPWVKEPVVGEWVQTPAGNVGWVLSTDKPGFVNLYFPEGEQAIQYPIQGLFTPSTPASAFALPDKLLGYKSAYGTGGKYKHEWIYDLGIGSTFTDKSGAKFQLLAKAGHVYLLRRLSDGQIIQHEGAVRVKPAS